jgi:hypothetical protein
MDKRALGAELCLAIEANDVRDVREVLRLIENVDDDDVVYGRRPLFVALSCGRFGIAKMLVDKGADVNYRRGKWKWYILRAVDCLSCANEAALWLMRHGSHIPRILEPGVVAVVHSYVFRDWTPENHLSWPNLFREQIVAILCSMSSKKGNVLVCPHSPYLLSRLFLFVAAAHFVWE